MKRQKKDNALRVPIGDLGLRSIRRRGVRFKVLGRLEMSCGVR